MTLLLLPASFWNEVGWNNYETFTDGRHLYIYAMRTEDDRIALGGRGAPYHFNSKVRDEYEQNQAALEADEAEAAEEAAGVTIVDKSDNNGNGGKRGKRRRRKNRDNLDVARAAAETADVISDTLLPALRNPISPPTSNRTM